MACWRGKTRWSCYGRSRVALAVLIGLAILGLIPVINRVVSGETGLAHFGQLQGSVGYVDKIQVMQSHSLWPDLEQIETELVELRSDWENYVEMSFYYADPDEFSHMMSKLQSGQFEALRAQMAAEIERETQKRQEILEQQEQEILTAAENEVENFRKEAREKLANEVESISAKLEEDMNAQADKVRDEYAKQILDLQVELVMAKLSDDSRTEKLEQLALLQSELESRLHEITVTYNKRLQEEQEKLAEKWQAEIESRTEEIMQKGTEQAEQLRLEFTQELAEFVASKESALQQMIEQRNMLDFGTDTLFLAGRDLGVASEAEAMQAKIEAELSKQRDALVEIIEKDIAAAAAQVAQEYGMKAVLGKDEVSFGGTDVTNLVVQKLQS